MAFTHKGWTGNHRQHKWLGIAALLTTLSHWLIAKGSKRMVGWGWLEGVRLHVLWDPRDGRLDAHRIVDQVPDWNHADIWFSGPAQFGQSLRPALLSMGLDGRHFHQELFELR